ncbi:SDR family oxidoreductase [Pedobacter montanisoli]|uniref:SDR family oxidoreductase n=1 Tax=Pedobacter montanisoli TaxID=2923277 RepID=A0ABS9ZV22_9SPHI|nr:SDR family oxidoreductase [Pedobacter montanisoli]MCJ0741503.1 SDR family oxidoreductase [Pedobacter montanisoli]
MSSLKNKVIIITGSSGLLGQLATADLIKKGAKVIGTDIHRTDFKDNSFDFFEGNISEKEDIDQLITYAKATYNRIDGLVNLAYPRTNDWGTKFEEIPYTSWQKNVDMQLNAVFYICQQVLEIMKQQNSGAIVNIASIYGVVGNDFSLYQEYGGTSPAAYSAIKGGIINFSRYLASYYGKNNVRVNCVSPGGIIDEKQQHPSFIKRYSEKSPLGRMGRPEEIAPAISFLLSDDASFITGHNLMVDGGWTSI